MKKHHILLAIIVIIIVILGVYGFSKNPSVNAPTHSSLPPSKTTASTSSTTAALTDPNYPVLASSTITMKLGDHIMIGSTLLTPTTIVSENRCAIGLQCIQAGTVVVAINVSSDDGASVINLGLGKTEKIPNHTITLDKVTPYPQAHQSIDPGDYRFIFTIK